jgi:hypothetical protein
MLLLALSLLSSVFILVLSPIGYSQEIPYTILFHHLRAPTAKVITILLSIEFMNQDRLAVEHPIFSSLVFLLFETYPK